MGIVDLLAIAPFYLGFLVTLDLRQLRAFRLLRLLKLSRSFASLNVFTYVFRSQIPNLIAAALVILILLILSSSVMYVVESDAGATQGTEFSQVDAPPADGQFNDITKRSVRDEMMIDLVHGEPILFGESRQRGVTMGSDGFLRLVEVADVGLDNILVHDRYHSFPSLAFALARLNTDDHSPTPFGVFRQVERPEYASEVANQVAAASQNKGPGELSSLLRSLGTWHVG